MDAETVVANLNEPVFALDSDGVITFVNQRFLQVYQCSESTAIGSDFTFFHNFVEEGFEPLNEAIQRVIDGETTVTRVDLVVRHPSSAPVPSQLHAEARVKTFNITGESGVLVTLRDITDRSQREEELTQLNTRLQLALEETNTGVWEWDLETDEMRWDDASENLFGYDVGEFPGTFAAFRDRISEDDVQQVEERLERAIETGEQCRVNFRVRPPEGDQRWIQSRGVVKYDDDRTPERVIGIQTDITEQKERERAIEQTRENLRQIIDLIPDPLYAKTLDDEVLFSNEANAELHGMTTEEIEGVRERDIESVVENIDTFEEYRRKERKVVSTGEPTTFEEELQDPDGEKHVFQTTRLPFEPAGRECDAVLGYARDVTDRKQYERDLEQSNEKLEQFASVVSHDLRNPLHVADSTLSLIEETGDLDRIAEVRDHLGRMDAMIDDLLTLSRAGKTVEDPQRVALAPVATESWETTTTEGARFESQIPESTTIVTDRTRLRHIFENLFRNAVDHNDRPPEIRVGLLDTSESTDDGPITGFFVEDDGDGIPDDERDRVFEHGYTTSQDGSGLGLSIVAEIVEAHDWTITIAESDAGGARFELTGVDIEN